ncbi:MAG TPA: rod shape-determining protein MreD, partial [Azospirillaceae bacterium]|nr:rod shape-determining protein MreD [Azospirillaceae bacterium]
HKLDIAGRNLAPISVTVMLVLAGMVPLHVPEYDQVAPSLALMAVYYWGIHRPDLVPPSAAFAVGLLQDLLSGAPLGMNALVLVLVHWVVVSQRRFFLANSFLLLWWGFTLIVLGAMLLQWFAYSLLSLTIMPIEAGMFQAFLTLSLFPLFAWLFIRVHRAFLQPH